MISSNLFTCLEDLLCKGGIAIYTTNPGDPDPLKCKTTIQPDGDMITAISGSLRDKPEQLAHFLNIHSYTVNRTIGTFRQFGAVLRLIEKFLIVGPAVLLVFSVVQYMLQMHQPANSFETIACGVAITFLKNPLNWCSVILSFIALFTGTILRWLVPFVYKYKKLIYAYFKAHIHKGNVRKPGVSS